MTNETDGVDIEGTDRKFDPTNAWDVLEYNRAMAAFIARERERVRIENANKNALLEQKRFGITRKVCSSDCTCSYCGNNDYSKEMKPGLNIPKQWWGFNSWWVWRREIDGHISVYYRCTPFWFLRRPQLAIRAMRDIFKFTL